MRKNDPSQEGRCGHHTCSAMWAQVHMGWGSICAEVRDCFVLFFNKNNRCELKWLINSINTMCIPYEMANQKISLEQLRL